MTMCNKLGAAAAADNNVCKTFKIAAKHVLYPEDDGGTDASNSIHPVKISFSRCQIVGAGCFGLVFKTRLRRVERAHDVHGAHGVHDDDPEVDLSRWRQQQQQTLALKIVAVKRRDSKEVSILKRLNHEHIAKLHFYFYCTYEYMDEEDPAAQTLRKELCCNMLFEFLPTTLYDEIRARETLPELDALRYFQQLLVALEYLHRLDICHRDVKPTNLLLDQTRAVLKLCDMGSATVMSDAHRDRNVAYVCSRFYRAPELILGSECYDSKVDIWSAACVLAEMLLGEPVFKGESAMGTLVEIVCILGPISPEDLRRMDSLILRVDDEVLSSRLLGTARERLASRMTMEASELSVRILGQCFRYIPKKRPCASKLLGWLGAFNAERC